jgi:hypothetical protein
MEETMQSCKATGLGGQPTAVFICPDGMTEYKGNTPVIRTGDSGRSSKKADAVHITSRVIGVQVVCGKLAKMFLYILDDFASKESDIMIEVVRQCIVDIQNYLAENGWQLPRILHFQADNW